MSTLKQHVSVQTPSCNVHACLQRQEEQKRNVGNTKDILAALHKRSKWSNWCHRGSTTRLKHGQTWKHKLTYTNCSQHSSKNWKKPTKKSSLLNKRKVLRWTRTRISCFHWPPRYYLLTTNQRTILNSSSRMRGGLHKLAGSPRGQLWQRNTISIQRPH